jgi:hypothetical protein
MGDTVGNVVGDLRLSSDRFVKAWKSGLVADQRQASAVGVRALTAIAARIRNEQDYRGLIKNGVVGFRVGGTHVLIRHPDGTAQLLAGDRISLDLRGACNALAHQDRMNWGFRIESPVKHFVILGVPAAGRFKAFAAEIDITLFGDAADRSGLFRN